ncbi:MAG: radical SAM protein [Thermoguttaceae bacterium]|nr:radical SAM protein [Thermoguttaceae bacterium]
MNANIHSFESLAALDGEGIRFDVFFTGCPLRCVYCHNPDAWFRSKTDMSAEDVFRKAKRFKPYFKNGGGVTFSGGEPLLNAAFINELAPMLRAEGIGYCLDTSGSVPLTDAVKTAIDGAEMVILDIKFCDPESYKKYTGGNFDYFMAVGRRCTQKNKRLWLRTVIVPGINDTEEDADRYAELVKDFKFERYELLPFHTMAFFKYENLQLPNPLVNTPPMDRAKLDALSARLQARLAELRSRRS